MKHYKVVLDFDGKYVSAVVFNRAVVTYSTETWAKAPAELAENGYHLLVFSSLGVAESFALSNRGCGQVARIFEVHVRGIVTLTETGRFDRYRVSQYSIRECMKNSIWWPWPEGSVMARKVKLVREVVTYK